MGPKQRKSTWLNCSTCSALVLVKDERQHQGECKSDDWRTPFVSNGVLYGKLEVRANVQRDVLLLHEATFRGCNLAIGDLVMISAVDPPLIELKSIFVRVKPDVGATSLNPAISSDSLDSGWRGDIRVMVQRADNPPPYADRLQLDCPEQFLHNADFEGFVRRELCNKYVHKSDLLSIEFFGKPIKLRVVEIASKDSGDRFAISESTEITFLGRQIEQIHPIGGVESIVNEIQSLMEVAFVPMSVHPVKCALLYGPAGSGKTSISRLICERNKIITRSIEGAQMFSKFFGETEAALRRIFDDAVRNEPALIIVDEMDALCGRRSNPTDQERRVMAAMANALDQLHESKAKVFVLATASSPDSIDSGLRRYGRIGAEIEVPVPDESGRLEILKALTTTLSPRPTLDDLIKIAKSTHGFVGADLADLFARATTYAMRRDDPELRIRDLEEALKHVRPSAMREILTDVPDVRWSDIGGQDDLKLKLRQAVEWPLKYGAGFARLGIRAPSGLLMFGPPGCSKTMVAKALATESGLNFLSIKGPELFSKWVGESERAVRELFRRARRLAPSIVFFDEIDALGSERAGGDAGSRVQERVLAQMLTEMDGVSPLGNVTVVAATNRPDKIDGALMRPGRLDRIVYVPLPDLSARRSIFQIGLAKMSTSDIDVDRMVEETDGYSGAEIAAVCHEAALKALEEDIQCPAVLPHHFESALQSVKPRTPQNLLKLYDNFMKSHS